MAGIRDTARSGEHDDPVLAVELAVWFSGGWPVVGVGHVRSSQGTRGVHPYSTAWLVTALASPMFLADPKETVLIVVA